MAQQGAYESGDTSVSSYNKIFNGNGWHVYVKLQGSIGQWVSKTRSNLEKREERGPSIRLHQVGR